MKSSNHDIRHYTWQKKWQTINTHTLRCCFRLWLRNNIKKEIWANAHETRHSMFNFVRRLSWSVSSIVQRKFTKCASQPKIAKNHICNRFHAGWASGKITISIGGTPLWCPRLRGISSPTGTKLPHRKLDTPGYHVVKTRSLYLTWAWYTTRSWQTDGQTDGQNSYR